MNHLNFARVCVEIKANSVIPLSFKINLGYGEPYEIRVKIPWKPKSCSKCNIFGHSTSQCPLSPCTQVKMPKAPRRNPVEECV